MTQIVRVGEPAAMPTPEGVMVLIPRPDGSKRLYASRDMTGAALMTDGLDGDAGYNLGVKRMRNVLIIDGPDYGHCLRKMAEIWANQDREAARVAALEARRKELETSAKMIESYETRGRAGGKTAAEAEQAGKPRKLGSSLTDPGMIHDETALRKAARRLTEPTTVEKMLAAGAVEDTGGVIEYLDVVQGTVVDHRPITVTEFLEEHQIRLAREKGHIALDPAETGEDGRYVGVCSCDWRGQLPRSSEAGANADTLNHLIGEGR